MTEVFVLERGSYSDRGIVGVHRTFDGAVAAMKAGHPPDAEWAMEPDGEGRWSVNVSWVGEYEGSTFPCADTYDITRYDVGTA